MTDGVAGCCSGSKRRRSGRHAARPGASTSPRAPRHLGSERPGHGGTWRSSFLRAPYARDALARLGVMVETVETACTWDRFDDLHAGRWSTPRRSARSRLGHLPVDARVPGRSGTVLHGVRAGPPRRRGGRSWDEVKAAVDDAIAAHGGTSPITTPSAGTTAGGTTAAARNRSPPRCGRRRRPSDPAGVLNPGVLIDARWDLYEVVPWMGMAAEHERAVAALRASYAAVPAGQPVRLAKRTSNLFRSAARPRGPGWTSAASPGCITSTPAGRTADVQGMCTYERLVDATLPHGLMPLVVPQLRTITLGGAVTGLGIESTSFRHGMPHESVLEMDVFTGAGELVTARPDGEHADLFAAFPNSQGSLGYATRLRIELQPIAARVALRNVRFTELDALIAAIDEVTATGDWDGRAVDAMDGGDVRRRRVVPGARARSPTSAGADQRLHRPGDLLPVAARAHDRPAHRVRLPVALGHRLVLVLAARSARSNPLVRRLWPARYRRSDVYHRLVRLEHRYRVGARIDRWRGRPPSERVVQDVEMPIEPDRRVPALVRRARADDAGVAVPAAGCATRLGVAAVPARRRPARTSTSASGARCRRGRARPTATSTGPSSARSTESAGTRRCTPTPTTTGRRSTGSTAATTYRGGEGARTTRTTG